MKKLKWVLLIITIIMMAFFLFATCRKTKALGSVFSNYRVNISEQDQTYYNLVVIYDLGQNVSQTSDFLIFDSTRYLYLAINNNPNVNQLYIVYNYGDVLETYSLGDTRLLECRVVEDTGHLYLIIYKLSFNVQYMQGLNPAVTGITRTMITRYYIAGTSQGTDVEDMWFNQGGLDIQLITNNTTYMPNLLLNASYIGTGDTVSQVDTWVNNQFTNYLTYNSVLNEGYSAGYDEGYADGSADGEEVGYDNGYDDGYIDGEDAGYINGWNDGNADGITEGYNQGYQEGYEDGESGESAVSKAVGVVGSVFGAIGTVLSIELFPGIPLGLFFLVPLFFAVLGLILWIWRRN